MIDPNIALSFKSPESPVEMQAKVQALRNQQLQEQAAKQQLQAGALELQMKQRALQDQEIARQAYMDSGGDVDQYERLLMTRGASPQTIFAFKKNLLDVREQTAKTAASELESRIKRGDLLRGAMLTFAQQAPDFKEQNWQGFLKQQLQSGNMTPDEYRNHVQSFPQYPGDDQLKMDANSVAMQSQLSKEALAKQTADAATARAAAAVSQAETGQNRLTAEMPGIQAGNTIKAQEAAGQKPIQPYEQAQLGNQAAIRAETARHNRTEEQQGAARLAVSQQEQALRQKQFDATYGALVDPNTGKPLDPEAAKAVASQDPLAVAVANYQAPPPNTSRGGPGASIMRKVLAINPDYQAQNWQAQGKVLTDYTSGSTSKSLVAMSTALGHLGELDQAAEALKNGDVRIINAVANRLGVEVGKDAVTTFKTIVHRVGPEIEKAYVGGSGTGGERGKTEGDFDPAMGYQQIKSNIAESAKLFRSKIGAEEYRWKQTMGSRPMPFVLTPDAQATLDRIGGAEAKGGDKKPAYQVGQTVMYNGAPHKIKEIKADGKLVLEQ
jgi:hypothetical protein